MVGGRVGVPLLIAGLASLLLMSVLAEPLNSSLVLNLTLGNSSNSLLGYLNNITGLTNDSSGIEANNESLETGNVTFDILPIVANETGEIIVEENQTEEGNESVNETIESPDREPEEVTEPDEEVEEEAIPDIDVVPGIEVVPDLTSYAEPEIAVISSNLGTELVPNGDFDPCYTGWGFALGGAYRSGTAHVFCNSAMKMMQFYCHDFDISKYDSSYTGPTCPANDSFYPLPDLRIEAGKTYNVALNVMKCSGGQYSIQLGGNTSGATSQGGLVSYTLKAVNSGNLNIPMRLFGTGNTWNVPEIQIDDISVREVLYECISDSECDYKENSTCDENFQRFTPDYVCRGNRCVVDIVNLETCVVECGAECHNDTNCDDGNVNTLDTCNGNCTCSHEYVNPYGIKFLTATADSVGPDRDCDGINDNWETTYGYSTSDPSVPSESVNSDSDGVNDYNEGVQGTNPHVSDSFRIRMVRISGNDMILTMNTFPGNNYTIEGTASLMQPNWKTVASFFGGPGSSTIVSAPLSGPIGYFRAVAHSIESDCTPRSGFVTVDGVNFMLDGKPFYFAGANGYFLWYGYWNCNETNPAPSGRCNTEFFDDAEALGFKVVRTWGFADGYGSKGSLQDTPGHYVEASFQKYDRLIKEAGDRDFKLVIPLVNNWAGDFGGMCQYTTWCGYGTCSANANAPEIVVHDKFYTDECAKGLYKDYVAYFLNRVNTLTGIKYKDDPTIMAWELANEPRAPSDKSGDTLNEWIAEMSAYIKSIDDKHLVATGEDGFYVNGGRPEYGYEGWDGSDFIRNSNVPTIDFASFHIYDWTGLDNSIYWIDRHAQDSRFVINKPLVAGELGYSKTSGNFEPYMTAWYDQIEASKINGDFLWMICPTGFTEEDGNRCVNYPSSVLTGRIISHSAYMNSYVPPANHAPVLMPISNIVVNAGDLVTIVANATDQDGDPLNYSIDSSWFTKSGNVFTWQTTAYLAGNYTFRIIVSDGDLGDSQAVDVMVRGTSYNCTMPSSGMIISTDMTLCPGTYEVSSGIMVGAGNIEIRCLGTVLHSSGSGTGIYLHNRDYVTLSGCTFDHFATGIYLHKVDYGRFLNNTLINCGDGFYFRDQEVNRNRYENNNLTNNNVGFRFEWSGSNEEIIGNLFINNSVGISHPNAYFGTASDTTITKNIFEGNYQAITLGLCSKFNISKNNITGSGNVYGVRLSSGSASNKENVIYQNNILIDNPGFLTGLAEDDGNNSWSYNGQGNYWSDYDTPAEGCNDANLDGICDAPRNISGGTNKDYYPFKTESGWRSGPNPYGIKFLTATSASAGPDVDEDGVNDNWERAYGYLTSHPFYPSASVDKDNDGLSDKTEGIQGTNPSVSDSFRIRMVRISGNDMILTMNTFEGNKYTIEGTASLMQPNWTTVASFFGGPGSSTNVSAPLSGPIGYFRAKAWPISSRNSSRLTFYETFDSASAVAANEGTITGTMTFVNKPWGSIANMTLSSYISYPVANNFPSTRSLTVEFWVRNTRLTSQGSFGIGGLALDPNSLGIFINGNVISEIRNNASAMTQPWSPGGPAGYKWSHVALSFTPDNSDSRCFYAKLYYDGRPGTPVRTCNFNLPTSRTMRIGWTGWYGYSNAYFDEFSIYDYTRTDAEIQADYLYMSNVTYEGSSYVECEMPKPQSTGSVQLNCSGLYVNGEPFTAKGVGYQPMPIGTTADIAHGADIIFNTPSIYNRDLPLLRAMNANTIRTWSNVTNVAFLNAAWNGGYKPIRVVMGFWINCGENYADETVKQKYKNLFRSYVRTYKNHPAVLVWALGNENNLGYCNPSTSLDDYYALCNELAKIAYEEEGATYHPVGIVNGDLLNIGLSEFLSRDSDLNYTDFWGSNVYPGKTFGNWFREYSSKTGKPLLITEYGIDALNNSNHQEYGAVQSEWVLSQWRDIDASNVTIGSTLMEYSDEWWKSGNLWSHDYGGYGTDRHPDGFSNEEWWGAMRIVDNGTGPDIMQPRQVYYDLRDAWATPNPFGLKFLSATADSAGSDNDCDGINDAWETTYRYSTSNPNLPSSSVDTDSDGVNDYNEGVQGTNPHVSDSFAIRMVRISGNDMILTMNTFPGNNYTIEGRASLTSGNWATVASFFGGPGSSTNVSAPLSGPIGYFRAVAHPINSVCAPKILTPGQYDLLDEILNTHLNYFLSSDAVTSYGMILGGYKVGDRARFGYSNPTEWGYLLQAYIVAVERGKITKAQAVAKITTTLNTLNTLQADSTQNYEGLFYPYYKVVKPTDPNKGTDIFPYADKSSDYNYGIPSIDDGLLYMSLLLVDGWARDNGETALSTLAQSVYSEMNFRDFVFTENGGLYMTHVIDARTGVAGTSKWNIYADEGGMMTIIEYLSGSINLNEFTNITDHQIREQRSWNGHTAKEAAWFNSMFTWSVRSIGGIDITDTPYSKDSLVPSFEAHLDYGDINGIGHPAFSDAMTQGLVQYFIPVNLQNQVPAPKSHVTPHALFVPLNVLPDLSQPTLNRILQEIKQLRDDSQVYYYKNGTYPYGFVVTSSPYDNVSYYGGYNTFDGKRIFETLSHGYTSFSIFNALQYDYNGKDFAYYLAKVPGMQTKVNEMMGVLYPVCTDSDNDGYAIEGGRCGPVDCNDANAMIFPGQNEQGTARCSNGLDDDCDGKVDAADEECATGCIMPANNLVIIRSGTICPGSYGNTGLSFGKNNIVVDCNEVNFQQNSGGYLFEVIGRNNITIKNCNSVRYHYGVWASSSNNLLILNNDFQGAYESGVYATGGTGITVRNNRLTYNLYTDGVTFDGVSESLIEQNTISNNGGDGSRGWRGGIGLLSSSNNIIRGNTIASNSQGVYVGSGCLGNRFYNNTFTTNTLLQAYDAGSNAWDYNGQGNRWSNYDDVAEGCIDANSNGFCDSPYVIDADSRDNYPYAKTVGQKSASTASTKKSGGGGGRRSGGGGGGSSSILADPQKMLKQDSLPVLNAITYALSNADLTQSLELGVLGSLTEGKKFTVVATDAEGNPIEGVKIVYGGQQAVSGKDGKASFTYSGDITELSAEKTGYSSARRALSSDNNIIETKNDTVVKATPTGAAAGGFKLSILDLIIGALVVIIVAEFAVFFRRRR